MYLEFLGKFKSVNSIDQLLFSLNNDKAVDHLINTMFNEFFLKEMQESLLDNIDF